MSEAEFSESVVAAILQHMNFDHSSDSLTIVQGLVDKTASSARLIGFSKTESYWAYQLNSKSDEIQATIPWQNPLSDRASIRTEIVNLFETAQDS